MDGVTDYDAVKEPTSRGRVGAYVVLGLRIAAGIDFLVGGSMKLGGAPSMVDLFTRVGAGQWLRYLVGTAEVSGGIGLLIAAVAGFAAIGLSALLVAATFTNLVIINDPPWAPLTWLIVVAIVAWRRWPRTRAAIAGLRR